MVSRLTLHWSTWDVSGNQDEFSPDAWHKFEQGHKSRAGAADHSEERGTSPAHNNTCTAACLYAPFVFTTKEAMNAIVAPKVQIDSEWEGRSSTGSASKSTGSASKSKNGGIEKAFVNLAESTNRLMQSLVQSTVPKEKANDNDKLRIFTDIIANPNVDPENRQRAQSLMASLLQQQVEAMNAEL